MIMTDQLDTKAIRAQMEALAGFTAGPWYANGPKKMEIVGRIHRVLNPENYPAAFVPAWDQPDAGQVDGTDEAIANVRLIAAAPDMRETILALCDAFDELRAENERLRRAAGVVSAVLQSERTRLGGQPFTGNWSIPQIGFRGTVDDALDMADAALAQKGGE